MKITAIAPWFGSKRTLAPRIVEALGPHSVYWEPFCGSMAVLLAKPRVSHEAVNDLHRDLINLGIILQDVDSAERLYFRVARTIFHEDMLLIGKEKIRESWEPGAPDPERAYWYMIVSWMGMNGLAGTNQFGPRRGVSARFSAKGGGPAIRWRSVVDSIPDWHARLFSVQILSRDGFEVIEQIDDAAGTVIYCDPPYIEKGSEYRHDFKQSDHARLADLLSRFKRARAVVSYYDHPELARLYPAWEKIDCAITKGLVNGAMRDETGTTSAPEVLLVNQASASGLFANVTD